MSQREDDIMKKLRKENPRAAEICDLVNRNLRKYGVSEKAFVLLTEEMTAEERIMTVMAKFMKEGCTSEEAESKAKEILLLMDTIFEDSQA